MLKKLCAFLFIFSSVLVLSAGDDKGDYIQNLPNGQINWTKRFIYVTGSGAPDLKAPNVAVARLGAERVAKLDAMRRLLELIQGITVTGSTTVKNSTETSVDIQTNVDGVVKGMEVVTTKYYSDGAVDVVTRVPIDAVSDKLKSSPAIEQSFKNKESVDIKPTASENAKDKRDILVLDVRGAKFTPALFPVVLTEDGKIIYSKKVVKEDVLKSKGMVHYIKDDLNTVKNIYGDTASMLVVKVKIKNKSDIIINKKDESSIMDKLNGESLADGKVVILF